MNRKEWGAIYPALDRADQHVAQLAAADERQNGIADYNDLAATLRDAAKDFTIDFKPAVLAALIRIEERLAYAEALEVARHEQRLAKIESKGCSCK